MIAAQPSAWNSINWRRSRSALALTVWWRNSSEDKKYEIELFCSDFGYVRSVRLCLRRVYQFVYFSVSQWNRIAARICMFSQFRFILWSRTRRCDLQNQGGHFNFRVSCFSVGCACELFFVKSAPLFRTHTHTLSFSACSLACCDGIERRWCDRRALWLCKDVTIRSSVGAMEARSGVLSSSRDAVIQTDVRFCYCCRAGIGSCYLWNIHFRVAFSRWSFGCTRINGVTRSIWMELSFKQYRPILTQRFSVPLRQRGCWMVWALLQ